MWTGDSLDWGTRWTVDMLDRGKLRFPWAISSPEDDIKLGRRQEGG